MFFVYTVMALCAFPFVALWYALVLVASPFVRAYRNIRRVFCKMMNEHNARKRSSTNHNSDEPVRFINEHGQNVPSSSSDNKKRHRRGHRGGRKHHKKG